MNTIHDMDGMDGMGPIKREPNEPVFHELWEERVVGMAFSVGRWGRGRNWGHFRFVIESIPAAEYLRMSYYERWITMIVQRLVTGKLVTQEELERGSADPSSPRPQLLSDSPEETTRFSRVDTEGRPRFRPDQRVRARNMHPRGHTRLPRYVRGKLGTVIREHGAFPLQDTDENGQWLGYDPQHVYTVRFAARDLWGDRGSARDSVYVDLWEDYLESA